MKTIVILLLLAAVAMELLTPHCDKCGAIMRPIPIYPTMYQCEPCGFVVNTNYAETSDAE